MTTSERVVELLTTQGRYRVVAKPFRIGSQEFDFTHILAGTGKANDIVLVIELTGGSANDVVTRSVFAFTRALDVVGSRRPVTVVLTSGQADKELVNAINRVCRVLPIGAPEGEDSHQTVKDWLSALLPLESPPPVAHLADWRGLLVDDLKESLDEAETELFISWAQGGKESVEDALAAEITDRADRALEEGDKP
ncbi:hypothetical protein ATY76_18950 [Rhizobium sp. R339]|uniref:hypothetical protein n=1 Tax=Rhizobium sp. R339 TaxID=1764273 RepID=UPI000B52DDCB|nr:hypothetical protein [Rhizobium sp. R339]OWV65336.1 hypothetical protein ATY76_18950 [Rhizobium sp. R339]